MWMDDGFASMPPPIEQQKPLKVSHTLVATSPLPSNHPIHPTMSERGRSRSPKRLTPSPHRNGDVAMSPRAPSAGGSASGSRVIVIDGLTKNVHPGHLREIFGFYGKVTGLDLPVFKVCE